MHSHSDLEQTLSEMQKWRRNVCTIAIDVDQMAVRFSSG
jgi:hypothetical protein